MVQRNGNYDEPDDLLEQADRVDEEADYQGAIAVYTRMIEAHPEDAFLRAKRGRLYWVMKDWQSASDDFDDAIRIDPTSIVGYAARGQIRNEAGDLRGARADLSKAICLDPDAWLVRWVRARVFLQLGELDSALEDVNAVLRGGEDMDALSDRAMLLEQLGDWKSAVRDWTRVSMLDPENALPPAHRGRAREALRDLQGALGDYEMARDLDPECLTYELLVRRLREDLGMTREERCA